MTSIEIIVRRVPGPADSQTEIVERKGLGHPDTLADALAERMSIAYAKHCVERYGAVLHHNLDKVYIQGGHCKLGLGEFEMTAPVTLVIGGRVSTSFARQTIDHQGLFEHVARQYLQTVLPAFDHVRWLRIEHASTDRSRFPVWFHPRDHGDLPELAHPTSSDTVAVTAWWPNTPTERLVLALERHLNREGVGPRYSTYGQDIKVMAVRRRGHIDITANVAVHPHAATDTDAYDAVVADLYNELDDVASQAVGGALSHRLIINSGDANPYRGKRHYLLGTGSCLELGEEGFVGRGNTPAGVIPLHRPKSVEAAYGKNPTYHAGKVYTIYAQQIARAVHDATGSAATVTVLARHSDPLREPALVDVALHAAPTDDRAVAAIASDVLATTDHVSLALDGRLLPR